MFQITSKTLGLSESSRFMIIALFILISIAFLLNFVLFLKFFRLWLQAKLSGADIKFSELMGMWLRTRNVEAIVSSKITAIQGGLDITTKELESHYLAGGRVKKLVEALILAKEAKIDFPKDYAKSVDLAKRDLLDAIEFANKTGNLPKFEDIKENSVRRRKDLIERFKSIAISV